MLSEEQHSKRKDGLGASDSPIIMGFSTYKTPYQLYLEKTGIVSNDNEVTERQYWGNKLESVILEHFAELNEVAVETPDTVYHPNYPFILANLDGYCPSLNAVIEVKNVSSFMRSEWDNALDDGIPMAYLIQIAKQVAIMNADSGYCAVLFGGNEYQQYFYQRDVELENMIIEADKYFWYCIQNRIEPDLVNVQDCRQKFQSSTQSKTVRINTPELKQVSDELRANSRNIKELIRKQETIKTKVMEHMKDAECLLDETGTPVATWKQTKRGRTFLIKD